MHDLLQDMGRDIVRQESPKEPGKRSRLWSCEEGTEKVEAIVLDLHELKEVNFSAKAFATMTNLRLLKIYYKDRPEGFEYLPRFKTNCKLHISGSLEFLSNKLRCLYWCGFPFKSIPTKFYPENIVELNMSYGCIKQLWKGAMVLKNLKFVNLSHCQNLRKTPNFSGVPNLECIILKGCISLVKIHPSIGTLKRLIILNLKDCKNLRYLVSAIDLESLESLILSGCSKLQIFPKVSSNIPHLRQLSLQRTSIKELPSSIKYLSGLVLLDLEECKNLELLPSSICALRSLEILTLSHCSKLAELPEDLGSLECLRELRANSTAINQLPPSIIQLKNLDLVNFFGAGLGPQMLKARPGQRFFTLLRSRDHMITRLDLSLLARLCSLVSLNVGACNLLTIPNDIGCLSSLWELNLSYNNFVSIPSSISQLSNLHSLDLTGCERLQALPEPPSSFTTLVADGCTSLENLANAHAWNFWRAGFSNCPKLLENHYIDDLVEMWVKNHLQDHYSKFHTILPGKEIPKWLSHHDMGDSVSIQVPPNWYDGTVGVAMCVVFKSQERSVPTRPAMWWGIRGRNRYKMLFEYRIDYFDHRAFKTNEEHLWFGFLNLDTLMNDLPWTQTFLPRREDSKKMTASIYLALESGHVIEKCAARLVFKEGVEEKDKDVCTSDEAQSEASQFSDVGVCMSFIARISEFRNW
ncbi:disease resistance-like protein DSC1 [Malania oleifera]|uniref:disease resistance-like protein DSC1 n=1 Tax=Malania oleifera TaxID=397392 RepID=UPI0025ADD8F7|nr:disease resistance-like protein DSC1 [Malania oleifera]